MAERADGGTRRSAGAGEVGGIQGLKKLREKIQFRVILSEAQDLLWRKVQEKAGSSGKHRPRNDNFVIFSATGKATLIPC